uniref:C2H2-type domain-containing protein n=1 Tax=Lutzomyia longipalpis TaxID=7200 RepID=A0A1B0CLR3_LUTLO
MFDLRLNQPLDRIDMVELLRICLKQTIPFCLYCNHATRIVVNAKHLAMHLIATHRFTATVDSITAEELQPETIVARVKKALDELDGIYINLDTFDSREEMALKSPCDRSFNCFQCRLTAKVHKELYQHNRKMHMKTVILCLMCKSALYSYSELLYHMCPGYMSTTATLELKFRCGFCSLHNIPSAFRLMVHLRKKHGICEICLEDCGDQFKLSNHVWKHKLQHLCFRCGIVYRNKPDITKHLFWKHGTESVTCKKCLQKKWPLVYHFCIPPAQFTCEHCPQIFTRAVSLTVHRRFHTGDFKYPCTEENCEKKFISKRILEKHTLKHSQFIADEPVFFEEKKPTPCELKDPVPMDVEEKPDGETEKVVRSEKRGKKSKSKRDDAKKVDLMDIDLPAPNLSESDSDMDIDRDDSSKDDAVQQEVAAIAPTIAPPAETTAEAEAADDTAAAKTVAMDVEAADVVADVVWKRRNRFNLMWIFGQISRVTKLSSSKRVKLIPGVMMMKPLLKPPCPFFMFHRVIMITAQSIVFPERQIRKGRMT